VSAGTIALSTSPFHGGALDLYVPLVDWGVRFPGGPARFADSGRSPAPMDQAPEPCSEGRSLASDLPPALWKVCRRGVTDQRANSP
jgi:hypothetical protein